MSIDAETEVTTALEGAVVTIRKPVVGDYKCSNRNPAGGRRCGNCRECAGYNRLCYTARYAAGWDSSRVQTVIVFPYDDRDELRRFLSAQYMRIRNYTGGTLPGVRIVKQGRGPDSEPLPGGILIAVYDPVLPEHVYRLAETALIRAGKGEIANQQLTPDEFHAIVPGETRQHIHAGRGRALNGVKFISWPAQFGGYDSGYAEGYREGFTAGRDSGWDDALATLAPAPNPPPAQPELTLARRALQRIWRR